MSITKLAQNTNHFYREMIYFQNARSAWREIMRYYLNQEPDTTFLLPSYIGYSIKEGSGIFDPVTELKANFEFYALDQNLKIDVEDLKSKSQKINQVVVLLVHYFGFPDTDYAALCNWLEDKQIPFVEDAAHAVLSDLVGGICGRRSDFTFYSLHKVFPLENGGALVCNKSLKLINASNQVCTGEINNFDLKKISDRRRENYRFLEKEIKKMNEVELLFKDLPEGVVPQTLPILVDSSIRDELYFKMNEQGFGLVSLYHTMINQLNETKYASSTYTSKQITNLPIHQDVKREDLIELIDALSSTLDDLL